MPMFKDRRGAGKLVNLTPGPATDHFQQAADNWKNSKVEGTQIEKSQYNRDIMAKVNKAENPAPRRDTSFSDW